MKNTKCIFRTGRILAILCFLLISELLQAQDLEPRFLSAAPIDMNFNILAYTYSDGNVLLDQSVPLEGTNVIMHAITPAFARSVNIFGKSGRLSAAIPFATATWNAELEGVDTSTTRNGIGDPIVAVAFNFIGVPALKGKDFVAYKHSTTLGISLKVRVPLGQYNSEKFFNLGTNRWSFGARIGLSRKIDRFMLEGYLNAWFFTENSNFYGGNRVNQDPLYSFQFHASYTFLPGLWFAFSFGQSYGGATTFNDDPKDTTQKNNRWGGTASIPLSRKISIKLSYMTGITTRYGANFDTMLIAFQHRWGGL